MKFPTNSKPSRKSKQAFALELRKRMKDGLDDVFSLEWESIVSEFRQSLSLRMLGYSECSFIVLDGTCSDESWIDIPLCDLVSEMLSERDNVIDPEGNANSLEEAAKDMENQAKRIRRYAAKIRRK